ncbi:unnamed protein product [Ilex paraguariensis]|uniref:Uncharacterized protein n=1 Tax=Ilex paraguariensis TaxID=185542 RepID=A0ABC8T7X9_9AQUA
MAINVPVSAVPAMTALLNPKASLFGGASGVGSADGVGVGMVGAGGEATLGPGDGDLGEGDGDGVCVGVGDGDGDLGDGAGAGTGVGVGGATTGDGDGVAVGEIFGAAPGACAMHEVAKRAKSMKSWRPEEEPIFKETAKQRISHD